MNRCNLCKQDSHACLAGVALGIRGVCSQAFGSALTLHGEATTVAIPTANSQHSRNSKVVSVMTIQIMRLCMLW